MYTWKKKIVMMIVGLWLVQGISPLFAASKKDDILNVMFEPAFEYEKVIDLGKDKNTVGDEVFRESTNLGVNENAGKGCFVNGQHVSEAEIEAQKNAVGYQGTPSSFCEQVLGGDQDISVFGASKQAPLIVRITKLLLRLTIILSITMVIYNGVMWIVEASKGSEVKDAKDNIVLIISGLLLALMSLGLINLVSSITISSLETQTQQEQNVN